ncbi:MAG: ribonuclease III [Hellea sp.]|nr:ribonuclease III [Hellea sp.]
MSYGKKLDALEVRLGYKFIDQDLLVRALTHGSYGDGRRAIDNYERLEFLGDRVLGLLTAEKLFLKSHEDEGALARKLNALVRKETCADVARELELGALIQMSKSTERQNGRDKASILGDVTESILGALYFEGGLETARKFYDQYWSPRVLRALSKSQKDPKTKLQELAAQEKVSSPEYALAELSGPDHRPLFRVVVTVEEIGRGEGEGLNKKEAERAAAVDLLEKWKPS